MKQLFAILKDSYREAMDAKVIWVLLGLSLLICMLTFSFTFIPTATTPAFQEITGKFDNVFPERGKGKIPVILQGTSFTPSDIQSANGEYTLRLKAAPSGKPDFNRNSVPFGGDKKDEKEKIDSIRFAVVNWLKPAGPSRSFSFPGGGVPIEVAEPTEVTPEEAKAVTDEQLTAFIKDQFATHAGMTDVTVTRVTSGIQEPEYLFDVKARSSDAVRGWPHTTELFFGAVTISKEFPLGVVLWFIEDRVINGYGAALTLLIGVVITGFFIPNMLRKGALDLLITKPVSRPALLIYKYIGGLSYMLILSIATIGGIWLVLAIRSGFWNPNFLLLIPILTFTFAILYAFSTFVAVFTRSSIAAILLTCGFAFFLYIVGTVKIFLDDYRADPKHTNDVNKSVAAVVDGLHFILPRYKDVDRLTTKLIADATLTPLEQYALAKSKVEYPSWGETFGVSLGFIAVMLALSCWRFQTRDS